jgi:urease subunit gamma/beta
VCEWARDGLSLPEVLQLGRSLLTPAEVLPGVIEALGEVRVEARFDDGTRLVVVGDPFQVGASAEAASGTTPVADGEITITNEATTAIGLTSHIHLAEVNPRLRLDRNAAFGRRLATATGETVWILPGESVRLPTAQIGGARVVVGNTGLIDGSLDDAAVRAHALETLRACGYLDVVDGEPAGDVARAEDAVGELMRIRESGGRS